MIKENSLQESPLEYVIRRRDGGILTSDSATGLQINLAKLIFLAAKYFKDDPTTACREIARVYLWGMEALKGSIKDKDRREEYEDYWRRYNENINAALNKAPTGMRIKLQRDSDALRQLLGQESDQT